MQIAQIMGGYSLGQADLLRRAMGKKKQSEMDEQRILFKAGATNKGIEEAKADEVFDLMAEFAKYGFNKSHTAAYGLIAYQTAWLKHHVPAEFFASLLSIESSNTDKVLLYMDDARKHDIEVLPPDINESNLKFAVAGTKVRFGLGAIKGLGASAIEGILEARESAGGRFESLDHFIDSVDVSRINKLVLQALTKCGAFESLGYTRAEVFDSVERIIEYGKRKAADKASGQVGLFGGGGEGTGAGSLNIPKRDEWPERVRLEREKEAVGFYITGHPMTAYKAEIESFTTATTADLKGLPKESEVRLAGIAVAQKVVITKKKGLRMSFVQFEDQLGAVEVTVFPKTYAKAELLLGQPDEPLLITAKIDELSDEGSTKLIAEKIEALADVRAELTTEVRFTLKAEEATSEALQKLKKILEKFPGKATPTLMLKTGDEVDVLMTFPEDWTVAASRAFVQALEDAFINPIASFR